MKIFVSQDQDSLYLIKKQTEYPNIRWLVNEYELISLIFNDLELK